MRMLLGLVDRVFFVVGFLLFLQLPNFVDHYTQRMGGFHDAEKASLAEYQSMANADFDGDLQALIDKFLANDQFSVAQTGQRIDELRERVERMGRGRVILEGGAFVRKLAYLTTELNLELATGTARAYQPGLPLTLEAAVCGLIGGILFSVLFNACAWWPRRRLRTA